MAVLAILLFCNFCFQLKAWFLFIEKMEEIMKKFLLFFLIVFACVTLVAVASPLSRNRLKFQDARNYCSDLGMHVAAVSQLELFCTSDFRNFPHLQTSFWTLEGTIFDVPTCREYRANKLTDVAYVVCARN